MAKNSFSDIQNARVRLMAHNLLDTELPRECPQIGLYGAFDLPDTLGLAGSLETEADFQGVFDRISEMREDEFIIVPLESADWYIVIYGTQPSE